MKSLKKQADNYIATVKKMSIKEFEHCANVTIPHFIKLWGALAIAQNKRKAKNIPNVSEILSEIEYMTIEELMEIDEKLKGQLTSFIGNLFMRQHGEEAYRRDLSVVYAK